MTHERDDPQADRTAYRRRETEHLLKTCSTRNRAAIELYLAFLEGRGRAVGTRRCATGMLVALDRLVNGRAFETLTPDDLTLALAAYARAHSGSTAHTFAAYVKAFYSWRHEGECPKSIKRVLAVGKAKPNKNVVPLTDAERDQLLETAGNDFYRHRATMRQALIWLLWDSGFRCSEALGLRIGSVHFDDQGGAHLVIPADAPELKTGPRTIYVVESAAALRVWIAMHPRGSDADAPLFCNLRDGSRQIPAYRVNMLLRELTERAGMRAVWPHLFRHTRATRAARGDPDRGVAGWNDAQMRAYFGWEPGSDMPAYYSHLAHRDMEARVRADANADAIGALVRKNPEKALAATAAAAASAAVAEFAKRMGLVGRAPRDDDDGASPAPLLVAPR